MIVWLDVKSEEVRTYQRSQLNENEKTDIFDRLFLITNFYVLKEWPTIIKKIGGGILIEN